MCNNFTDFSRTHRPPPSPPTRRVIYSFDEDVEPVRLLWPLCCLGLEFEDDNANPPQRPQRRKKTRRRVNPFIESVVGVESDASADKSDGDNDLADFIVPDEVEYLSRAYVFSTSFMHFMYITLMFSLFALVLFD